MFRYSLQAIELEMPDLDILNMQSIQQETGLGALGGIYTQNGYLYLGLKLGMKWYQIEKANLSHSCFNFFRKYLLHGYIRATEY